MTHKYNRSRLRAHDSGIDRHNKGLAYDKKKARLEQQHKQVKSGRRRKKGTK